LKVPSLRNAERLLRTNTPFLFFLRHDTCARLSIPAFSFRYLFNRRNQAIPHGHACTYMSVTNGE
jgi:hypothetical protein